MSKLAVKTVAATALLLCASAVFAQKANAAGGDNAAPQNVLQLSAKGSVQVQQDVLVIRMAATKEAADAASVQKALKQVLDAALTQAKRNAQPKDMEVRSGDFSLNPRYSKDGKINGWQGHAELILEGKDFARISSAAGELQNMTISSISFDLSREARTRVEGEAQSKAIEAFKARAQEIAKNFGFNSYTLREVAVSDQQGFYGSPYPKASNSAMMKMASDSAVPVEAGKTQVEVTVSGSVQLR